MRMTNDLDGDYPATPDFGNEFDTVAGDAFSIDHLWKTYARRYGQPKFDGSAEVRRTTPTTVASFALRSF